MKPKKRQKMCYNCEGEVDLDVIVCPFCAADLRQEKPEQERSSFSASAHSVKQLNGQQQSLYPPAYSQMKETPLPPADELTMQDDDSSTTTEQQPSDVKSTSLAILLFAFGVQLILLGVFMLFFQTHGTLLLKWDARLWFLYVFASIPLLLFGYRGLSRL